MRNGDWVEPEVGRVGDELGFKQSASLCRSTHGKAKITFFGGSMSRT